VFAIADDEDSIDFSATERMFVVDVKASPGNLKKASPDNVQTFVGSAIRFDDVGVDENDKALGLQPNAVSFPRGIGTTLGPGSPGDMTSGRFVGTVYIEQAHFNVIRKTAIDPKPWPPEDSLSLYQVTSVAYSTSAGNGLRAGRRYHGYRGTVVEVTATEFFVVFQSQAGAPKIGPCKFKLDDASQYDSDPPTQALDNAPSISAGPITKGAQGALFVALPYSATLELIGGKLPIGLG
jgi:hypothetical protein